MNKINATALLRYVVLIGSLSLLAFNTKEKSIPHCKFSFEHSHVLKGIPEPSDIAYDYKSGHCFIVSDHGILFECDLDGNIIRKAKEEGQDFEGVEVTDSFVYVSDETPRKVYKYRKDNLELVRTFNVTWGGALNRAFESITWNAIKKCFILVSQEPVAIVEYDEQFHELNRYPFHGTRDMSGARWYKGAMYLLANKDETIFKCDPVTYAVQQYYKINVLNPEGLDFDANGNVTITSDDLQRIYFFKNLPTINNNNQK